MTRTVSLILAFCMPVFAACASTASLRTSGDLAHLLENRDATHRVDTLPGGHGSGVVISRDGHILTCAHVVEGVENISITITERGEPRTFPATIVATDPVNDLAVVKVERRFTHVVALAAPTDVSAGDEVYNIGYPYDFGEFVQRGYVLRLDYDGGVRIPLRGVTLVHIPDGPGTSGSGVFLRRTGTLIGVMRSSLWISDGRSPPLIMRVLVPVDRVIAFLTAHDIPFVSGERALRDASEREGHEIREDLNIVIMP